MVILMTLLSFGQVEAGPLDAFRANRASIRVRIDFEERSGVADRDVVSQGLVWNGNVAIVPEPMLAVDGRWESDGPLEHLVCRPTEEAAKLFPKATRPGEWVRAAPLYEYLTDGEVTAYHLLDDGSPLRLSVSDRLRIVHHGPFYFKSEDFIAYLDRLLGEMSPTVVKQGTRGGHPCEVAIYKAETDDGKPRDVVELSYDPSIGYLPRFIRTLYRDDRGEGSMEVTEIYLTEARMSEAGGFAPTEWYRASFAVDDFDTEYPNYSDDTVLRPTYREVGLTHFRVTEFEDLGGPIRFDHLEGVREVMGPGGIAPLPSGTSELSLAQAKAMLGGKLTERRAPVLPNIDQAELHEFDRTPGRRGWVYLLAGLGVVGLAGLVIVRRRAAALLLIGLVGAGGCGVGADPVVKLTGAFTETRLVYDAGLPAVPLTMVLRNEGNIPLRIFKVDGGCSCRQVDHAKLPTTLEPGRNLQLAVSMSPRGNFESTSIGFNVETEQGTLAVPLSLFALPDHTFSPSAVGLADLIADGEGQFELTHRQVYPANQSARDVVIEFPAELVAEQVGRQEGRVGGAPDLAYRDTTYRVRVEDQVMGLRRSIIVMTATDRPGSVQVPVVWRRVEYLSSSPGRVILGGRPVRVFLRCPDIDVELQRIESAPEGVEAFVASPRELVVRLSDDAPGIIEGVLSVGTTATDRPPLEVPVVRYAPSPNDRASID